MHEPNSPEATSLYRLYREDGQLLYVGISRSPFSRLAQHAGQKAWWDEVASMTRERYPSREAALAAERLAIRTERPLHNVVFGHTARQGKMPVPDAFEQVAVRLPRPTLEQVTVRLPRPTLKQIQRLAREEERSVSQYLQLLIAGAQASA